MRQNQSWKYLRWRIMSTVITRVWRLLKNCILISKHFHVICEIGKHCNNLFDSLNVPAAIPCLVTCFKLLFLPTQKIFHQKRVHDFSTTYCCGVFLKVKSSSRQINKETFSDTMQREYDHSNTNRYIYMMQTFFYSSPCDKETVCSVNAWRACRFYLPDHGVFT